MKVNFELHVDQLSANKGVGLSAYPLPSAPPSKGAAGMHARTRARIAHACARDIVFNNLTLSTGFQHKSAQENPS